MHRRRTFRRSLIAAVFLSLALVGSTLATTSSGMTQTVVIGSLSLTGVPATMDFGSGNAGDVIAAPSTVDPVVDTANATGANLYIAISDFQDANLDVIPATNEQIFDQTLSGTPTLVAPYNDPNTINFYPSGNAPVQLAYQDTAGSWSIGVALFIHVPNNALPGAYSSVATFSVVDRP